MKIYTRTGDRGETTLFSGQKVPKNTLYIEALGAVDECNTAVGIALSFLPSPPLYEQVRSQLEAIQNALFDLGAALATPRTKAAEAKIEKTRFDIHSTFTLESWIDAMEAHLPPLKTFILPGGHPAASFIHLARSICRRAERTVVPLHQKGDVPDAVMAYLNRLSDYLFVLSRYVNFLANTPEKEWEKESHPNSGITGISS